MSNLKKMLGKRIKFIRKERKMTQERLAELVEIGTPNISYIESGKFAPSSDTLQKIAIALNVSPRELYDFSDFRDINDIKKELFEALESNENYLKIMYEIFLALKFHLK